MVQQQQHAQPQGAVPAPALPPDADDLLAPPPHLRAGHMASYVWSVMRLTSTNAHFAWCTVCHQWLRYRPDFNAVYIKSLYRHCRTRHRIGADGKLHPVSAPRSPASAPAPAPARAPIPSVLAAPSPPAAPPSRPPAAPFPSAPFPTAPPLAVPPRPRPPRLPAPVPPIRKRSAARQCQITAPVRRVADRTQRLIFNGTNLFFTSAHFRVPNSVPEAFDIMRRGTFDVHDDAAAPASPSPDLYYRSWSHTQFFAAQMAALGFAFRSCNLVRSTRAAAPPPVEQWLKLERYIPPPQPPPRTQLPPLPSPLLPPPAPPPAAHPATHPTSAAPPPTSTAAPPPTPATAPPPTPATAPPPTSATAPPPNPATAPSPTPATAPPTTAAAPPPPTTATAPPSTTAAPPPPSAATPPVAAAPPTPAATASPVPVIDLT